MLARLRQEKSVFQAWKNSVQNMNVSQGYTGGYNRNGSSHYNNRYWYLPSTTELRNNAAKHLIKNKKPTKHTVPIVLASQC